MSKAKNSHGDHEEIEHGLANTLVGLPISSNIPTRSGSVRDLCLNSALRGSGAILSPSI